MTAPVATEHTLEELLDLAYKDELTGLYNRRYLNDELARRLTSAAAESTYAFLLIDIDFFKNINDTYGHAAGDKALRQVARMLEAQCEDDDVPIRFAGDEFVLLLAETDSARAQQRAEEIVAASRDLSIPLDDETATIQLTISIGVAAFPENGEDWRTVLEGADQAL